MEILSEVGRPPKKSFNALDRFCRLLYQFMLLESSNTRCIRSAACLDLVCLDLVGFVLDSRKITHSLRFFEQIPVREYNVSFFATGIGGNDLPGCFFVGLVSKFIAFFEDLDVSFSLV